MWDHFYGTYRDSKQSEAALWIPPIDLSTEELELLEKCRPHLATLYVNPIIAEKMKRVLKYGYLRKGPLFTRRMEDGRVAMQLSNFAARNLRAGHLDELPSILKEALDADLCSVIYDQRWKIHRYPFCLYEKDDATEYSFRYAELFAGIGGFRLALDRLGGQCVFSSEIERNARQIYHANFGDYPSGDITCICSKQIPKHELLVGGFPCTSFSRAGNRKGLVDDSGALFFEICRVLGQVQPQAFVLENVPFLLEIDEGMTFRKIVYSLQQEGYQVSFTRYFASECLAQNRQRILIAGIRQDLKESIASFSFQKLCQTNATFGDIEQTDLTEAQIERLQLTEAKLQILRKYPCEITGTSRILNKDSKLNTIMASYKSSWEKSSQLVVSKNNIPRFLSPVEVARAQGFPKDFKWDLPDENSIYRLCGNAVPPAVSGAACQSILRALGRDILNDDISRYFAYGSWV